MEELPNYYTALFNGVTDAIAALDRQDYQEAFRYAHTIKGICLNLGLTTLLQSSIALADNLRAGQADSSTPALFQALRRDYEDAVTAIRSLSGF